MTKWATQTPARAQTIAAMRFHLGPQRVRSFRRMLVALARDDYATAAAEALDSEWARQTPASAQTIAAMLRTGEG